jgi:hypothetical protein
VTVCDRCRKYADQDVRLQWKTPLARTDEWKWDLCEECRKELQVLVDNFVKAPNAAAEEVSA